MLTSGLGHNDRRVKIIKCTQLVFLLCFSLSLSLSLRFVCQCVCFCAILVWGRGGVGVCVAHVCLSGVWSFLAFVCQIIKGPHCILTKTFVSFFPAISIVSSVGTLIFLILSGDTKNIFKRKFSERLVVYLAAVDIMYRWATSCSFFMWTHDPRDVFLALKMIVVFLTHLTSSIANETIKIEKIQLMENAWVSATPFLLGRWWKAKCPQMAFIPFIRLFHFLHWRILGSAKWATPGWVACCSRQQRQRRWQWQPQRQQGRRSLLYHLPQGISAQPWISIWSFAARSILQVIFTSW